MTSSFFRYSWSRTLVVVACTTTVSLAQLPAHVKTILDNHAQQLQIILRTANDQPHLRMGRHVYEVPWLPGYLIKHGVNRFYNAKKLKAIIQQEKLDLIDVAIKDLYHVPGRPEKISDKNYLVIVKKVVPDNPMPGQSDQRPILNLEQVKQLCRVALKARHYDLHTANYIVSQGKLVIIDTDENAMPSARTVKKFDKDRVSHGVRVRTVAKVHTFNDPLAKIAQGICQLHTHYNDEAKAYILAHVQQRNQHFQHMKKRSAFLRFFNLA